jgi:hypothetical protein
MQINPAKWRARLTAEGQVVVTFLAYDSESFEIRIPLQMLRQMVQIFREMLGRPAGKEAQPMEFQPVRYQTGKDKPPHIQVAMADGGVGIMIRTNQGLDADMALSTRDARILIQDLQDALARAEGGQAARS